MLNNLTSINRSIIFLFAAAAGSTDGKGVLLACGRSGVRILVTTEQVVMPDPNAKHLTIGANATFN